MHLRFWHTIQKWIEATCLHWTNHLLWYKRISHILTVSSVDDKTSDWL